MNTGHNRAALTIRNYRAAVIIGDNRTAVAIGDNRAALTIGDKRTAMTIRDNRAAVTIGDNRAAGTEGIIRAALDQSWQKKKQNTLVNKIQLIYIDYRKQETTEQQWLKKTGAFIFNRWE